MIWALFRVLGESVRPALRPGNPLLFWPTSSCRMDPFLGTRSNCQLLLRSAPCSTTAAARASSPATRHLSIIFFFWRKGWEFHLNFKQCTFPITQTPLKEHKHANRNHRDLSEKTPSPRGFSDPDDNAPTTAASQAGEDARWSRRGSQMHDCRRKIQQHDTFELHLSH
jgi:hypothetical protein